MTYLEMVKSYMADTASKLMLDLAKLLDNVLFQLDETKKSYQQIEMAALREKIFHDFCALCVLNDIPMPAMEEILISVQGPSVNEEAQEAHAKRVKNFVEPALAKLGRKTSVKAKQCRTLLGAFANLPSLSGSYPGSVNGKELECLINQLLIGLGQEPVRPDYRARTVGGVEITAPKQKKVVIVDDDQNEMLKTARAIAGWEGLEVSFFHYVPSGDRWSMTPEERQAELPATAKAVVEMKPDVVLMDQGLDLIQGDDLVKATRELCPDSAPVFVANTGGSDDDLIAVGALENCGKGRCLRGIIKAVNG